MKQLEKTREELLQVFQGLTDEQLNIRTSPECWSIAQILHHLYLTERIVIKLIRQASTQPDVDVKEKPIHILLDRTVKVEAPKDVLPKEEFLTKQELIELLQSSRQRLLQTIDQITDVTILEHRAFPHPFLGKLSLSQWIDLIHFHEKRHIEQIREVMRSI